MAQERVLGRQVQRAPEEVAGGWFEAVTVVGALVTKGLDLCVCAQAPHYMGVWLKCRFSFSQLGWGRRTCISPKLFAVCCC